MRRKDVLTGIDFLLGVTSFCVLVIFIFMVWYAHLTNLWPAGPWGLADGNHGPWHGFLLGFFGAVKAPAYILEKALLWIFSLQIIAILLTCLSLNFERQRTRSSLLILNTSYFFVLIGKYGWLID